VQVGAIPGEAACQRDHLLRSGEYNGFVLISEAKHGTVEAADAADDETAELRIVLGHGFELAAQIHPWRQTKWTVAGGRHQGIRSDLNSCRHTASR